MRYNLLFRWFVGVTIEDAVRDHSVFSKNRDWLREHELIEPFFTWIMGQVDKGACFRASPSWWMVR